ncbi:unnamed protein product [Amaranthus hypochondriacus]
MASEELARMLQVITEKLESLEKKTEESEEEKARQNSRMDTIADMVLQTTRKLNELENEDVGSGNNLRQFDEDRGLKIDLPEFDGGHDSEAFLDWVRQIETVFEYKGFNDKKRFKLSVLKLTKLAALWYENLKANRRREGKEKIDSWEKLKKKMREKWVNREYEQEQYLKLTHLSQENMSVEDYIKEFEKMCLVCDLQEKKTFKMASFVKGLSKSISQKVEVTHYTTFSDVCKLAIRYETQLKEEKPKTSSFKSPMKFTPTYAKGSTFQNKTGGSFSHKSSSSSSKFDKGKEKTIISPSELATRRKCFKCHGRGHIASECPSKNVLTAPQYAMFDEEENLYNFVTQEENEELDDDYDEEIPPENEFNMMVVRKVLFSEPQVDETQRNNLFHTRCKIGEKTCNVIVDGGAQTDVVSSEVVSKLKLTTRDHEEPYKLNWLNDGNYIRVKKQALVSYSIGNFEDERWCDVLPMDACHLLLGRSWQFDHDSEHRGKSNVYLVTTRDGRKVKLLPLPPKVAKKDKEKSNYFVSCNEFEKIVEENGGGYALVVRTKDEEVNSCNDSSLLKELLEEFKDVFPNDLPKGLPPIRGIEHVIDLIPGAPLPNKAAYRCNLEESKEIERQVNELIERGFVRESLSPCAVPLS